MFRVQFFTDNAAFDDSENESCFDAECARILRHLSDTMRAGIFGEGVVTDVNGNTIGYWSCNADPQSDEFDAQLRVATGP